MWVRAAERLLVQRVDRLVVACRLPGLRATALHPRSMAAMSGVTDLASSSDDDDSVSAAHEPSTKSDPGLASGAGTGEDVEAEETPMRGGPVDLHLLNAHGNFTSESFKVRIDNLPKHLSAKMLRKVLEREQVAVHKVKKGDWWDFAFVTFRSEPERVEGLRRVNTLVFKGLQLRAHNAAPALDPVLVNRAKRQATNLAADGTASAEDLAEATSPSHDDRPAKRARLEPTTDPLMSIHDRLADQVTPLWRRSYEEQLACKRDDIVRILRSLVREFPSTPPPAWLIAARRAHDGLPCPLDVPRPSPVLEGYRNKCEFAVGYDPEGATTVGFMLGAYAHGIVTVAPVTQTRHVAPAAKLIAAEFEVRPRWREGPVRSPRVDTVMFMYVHHRILPR